MVVVVCVVVVVYADDGGGGGRGYLITSSFEQINLTIQLV